MRQLKHILGRLWYDQYFRLLSQVVHLDPTRTISLFCDPRGGSTWLAELLNQIPKTAIIDEPLHLNSVPVIRDLGFSWRQYIPEFAVWPEAKQRIHELLSGSHLNRGICCRNTTIEFLRAQSGIAKIIRGKALLPWYTHQFSFAYAPICLVRHPLAVVNSQLQHGAWSYPFQAFELPNSPYNDLYQAHISYLSQLGTKEEQLAALWCISNLVPLKHPKNNQSWITLSYEHLLLNPQVQLREVFARWGLPVPDQFFAKLHQPSSTAQVTQIDSEEQITKWQRQLKPAQIERLLAVLGYFEVDFYSTDPLPSKPLSNLS